jgi:hypothetical protein
MMARESIVKNKIEFDLQHGAMRHVGSMVCSIILNYHEQVSGDRIYSEIWKEFS